MKYNTPKPARPARPPSPPKPRVVARRSAGGVSRIVRDDYHKKVPNKLLGETSWFDICRAVRKRDQCKCVQCGTPEKPKEKIYHDVHHIRRLSDGGRTVMSNLILLCDNCHQSKHRHKLRK